MKMMLDILIKEPVEKINYNDSIFIIGSCFTEHIGCRLLDLKFKVFQNPNGILFDPLSVCKSLNSYVENIKCNEADLFFYQELWQSWNHHSIFSGTDKNEVVDRINDYREKANQFLQNATWLIITLGSSFHYVLKDSGKAVANCHRAPAQMFTKEMLSINTTYSHLNACLASIYKFNPAIKIIFTVSPVRHIRDGVQQNNRSKARLIESVHNIVETDLKTCYFPAYELMIDVLRDYRFYDVDLIHPNYAGTTFVFEKFRDHFIQQDAIELMEKIKQIKIACKHKPNQPNTQAHRTFLLATLSKVRELSNKYPDLNLEDEEHYLIKGLENFTANG